jgi:predicted RNA-binding protein YlqC (UPF0109 family)
MDTFTRNLSFANECDVVTQASKSEDFVKVNKEDYVCSLNLSQKLNKKNEDITCGIFVGKKGFNISTISGKTKNAFKLHENAEFDETLGELGSVKLHVFSYDNKYYMLWNTVEGCKNMDLFNELLLKEVEFCENKIANPPQKKVNKIKKQPSKKVTNKKQFYEFYIPVASRFIGKVIGVEGSNLHLLRENLKKVLSLDKNPRIRVNDSGRDKNDSFTLECKNKDCYDTNGIWIVVQYFGNKGYREVKEETQKFMNRTLKDYEDNNFSVSSDEEVSCEEELHDDDDDENDGWN